MKKVLLCLTACVFFIACNDDKTKTADTAADKSATPADKPPADLPYTATYSSSWNQDVSDADLKMVLTTYKNWADGNIGELAKGMADTVTVDMATGTHVVKSNADLMKMWATTRDSLSSVSIEMGGWNKMHSIDKNTSFVVTWYKEIDTYKNGKIDSADYHDINQIMNGKISWYITYKRPLK